MEIKTLNKENFIYKVKENETLKEIANKFKTSEIKLIKDNYLESKTLEEGDVLYIEKENSNIYVVKPMDNIYKISKKFNISIEKLKEKNKLKNNHIFIGQILII